MKNLTIRPFLFGLGAIVCLAAGPAARANDNDKAADKKGTETATETEFQRMDTNTDGKISADEHSAGAKKMFETMDANKDGKVTADEMTAAHEQVTGVKAKRTEMSASDKIKMLDTNNDGALSADEHTDGAKKMFDKMDADKDGFLTKSELTAGHKMMKKDKAAK